MPELGLPPSQVPLQMQVPVAAVLFDLDGTLLDTAPDLARAGNAMRLAMGLPALPEATVVSFVGKGMRNLVQRLLAGQLEGGTDQPGEPRFEEALAVFRREYHVINGTDARPYPGLEQGLAALRAVGLPLAVVTNKPAEFTLPLLERTGLRDVFAVVVSGDTCARVKPDPLPLHHACAELGVAPEAAVMVGDSINDVLAARAAGIPVLAVPYGYNEGRDPATLPADALVADVAEAARWILARGVIPA